MVDVRRLNKVLPASGIDRQELATVSGLCRDERLDLVEPPAGQDEPMVDALKAVELSLVASGATREDAPFRRWKHLRHGQNERVV